MNPHAQRYRKISPFEWIYLSLTPYFQPCAVQLWIETETLPSHSALESALCLAVQAHPGARLVPQGAWWIDSGKTPAVRVISASESVSLSHPVFHEPFPFGEIPPLDILLWEGKGLLFRCSHALMDAGGLLFFAEETFRALRGEALRGTAITYSERDYLLALKHPVPRPRNVPNKISPIAAPVTGHSGFVWERRSIPGQIPAPGARIAAALSQLARNRHDDAACRFMIPVNLRLLDAHLHSVRNFSNFLTFDDPAVTSWTDFYAWTAAALARHDERATSPLDAIFPWMPLPALSAFYRWVHERQVRTDRYLFSGLISHIGTISLAAFSSRDCSPKAVSLLPFDAAGSAISLLTVQHENGLEISVSCPAATGSGGRLNAVLDRICADLTCGRTAVIASPAHMESVNGPAMMLPVDLNAYALFARQVEACPDRIAVSEPGRRLSYAELERYAVVCSGELHARGVRPGDRVAILAGRSVNTIIALLGILRMGASFVPLDAEWPPERICFVLQDCGPSCLAVDDQYAELTRFTLRLLFSEMAPDRIDRSGIAPDVTLESAAYVIYTSGSTGLPKGVVIGQRSLLNYLIWSKEAYLQNLDAPVVFPFFTSFSFDLTLTSIFLPLISGGELRIFPQTDALAVIQSLLSDQGINAVKLTPSHLRIFAGVGLSGSGLRKFIVGGEALSTQLAREIIAQSNADVEIFNEYGPTEATVGCVVHRFDEVSDLGARVPIGLPIANTEVLLLDPQLRPVNDGEPGELYLSGECLAIGYLARPEEEQRFMPHALYPGRRMYRTGDRGVRLAGGLLDYRGRSDGQVKVRGHRVEIGEIESAIDASGLCLSCAVMQEPIQGDMRLAAFVIWREAAREEELRSVLAGRLPGYMIPTRIVGVNDMPLTMNGKVDKSRLLRLSGGIESLPQQDTGDVAGDMIETALRTIVAELSGCSMQSISPNQSLLDLGFDSLRMMLLFTSSANRLLPASQRKFLLMELGKFLHAPTVENLVRRVRQLAGNYAIQEKK